MRCLLAPQHHLASPGKLFCSTPRNVTIVGGGIAGCAAAMILAERGAKVVILERETSLGGRAGGRQDQLNGGTHFEMTRGFHAFFRQYHNLRSFLRRVDPAFSRLKAIEDYPLRGPEGREESFAGLPLQPPLNLLALIHRTPTLNLKSLAKIAPWPALEMLAFEHQRTFSRFDGITASALLDKMNFPPQARQMLFEVFAHSFFDREEEMSAARMLEMFHFYFTGNREGLLFDVLDDPFTKSLWRPIQTYLEARGVAFHFGAPVQRVERWREGWRAIIETENSHKEYPGDGLILATAVPGLQQIVQNSPDLNDPSWCAKISSLPLARPFAVWRLWLDRPSAPKRPAFAGIAGSARLDNISRFHLFEDESREWATQTGGSVIELHAYALPNNANEEVERESLKRDLWRAYIELCPEHQDAKILDERFLIRRDCPGFPPGSAKHRPKVETPFQNLALAGDMLQLPFPAALMEAAASSGFLAANQILSKWGVQGTWFLKSIEIG